MKTGLIGLGAMGRHMAIRLRQAGLLVSVYNRTQAVAEAFASRHGCHASASVAEIANRCECVVLCVPGDADVTKLATSLAQAMSSGGLVIDCSTVSAGTARRVAQELSAAGIGFLDCPVSGGTEGARDGSLAIMAGGREADFERGRSVLGCLGTRITHLGPAGAGQATKAVNQIMVAGINQAVTEALALGTAEGLPMDAVIDTIGGGAAASWHLENRGKTMVRGEYPLGFKVSLHRKDLGICQQMAAAHGVSLPIVEMTLVHYRHLIENGHGEHDISSLFSLKHSLFEDQDRNDGRNS